MRTIRTDKNRAEFLAELKATGGNVTKASELVTISRRAAYEWREDDSQFASDWDEAVEAGTDELVQEARRRAWEGVDEPVFYKGAKCGAIRKYSDTLLIFLLKARRPEYRDRLTVDVNKLDADIERELALVRAGSESNASGEVAGEDSIH